MAVIGGETVGRFGERAFNFNGPNRRLDGADDPLRDLVRTEDRELEAEQQTLQQKQTSLATMNEYLTTTEGTEQVLRNKYNVVKPGEGIVVVVDPAATIPVTQPSGPVRWWRAILSGLGFHKK